MCASLPLSFQTQPWLMRAACLGRSRVWTGAWCSSGRSTSPYSTASTWRSSPCRNDAQVRDTLALALTGWPQNLHLGRHTLTYSEIHRKYLYFNKSCRAATNYDLLNIPKWWKKWQPFLKVTTSYWMHFVQYSNICNHLSRVKKKSRKSITFEQPKSCQSSQSCVND